MADHTDDLKVTATREQWKALVAAVPDGALTYTAGGELAFAAYQAIADALEPDTPERSRT